MNSDDGIVKLARYQMGFQTRLLQLAMKSVHQDLNRETEMEKAALAKIIPLLARGAARGTRALNWMGDLPFNAARGGTRALNWVGDLPFNAASRMRRELGDFRNLWRQNYNQALRGSPFGPRTVRPFPGTAAPPSAAVPPVAPAAAAAPVVPPVAPAVAAAPVVPPVAPAAAPPGATSGVPPVGGPTSTATGAGFEWPGWMPGWAQTAGNWTGGHMRAHPQWASGIGGGLAGFGASSGLNAMRDAAKRRKLRQMGFMDRLMLAGNLAFSPESFSERYM